MKATELYETLKTRKETAWRNYMNSTLTKSNRLYWMGVLDALEHTMMDIRTEKQNEEATDEPDQASAQHQG